jgi:hypothetical protein
VSVVVAAFRALPVAIARICAGSGSIAGALGGSANPGGRGLALLPGQRWRQAGCGRRSSASRPIRSAARSGLRRKPKPRQAAMVSAWTASSQGSSTSALDQLAEVDLAPTIGRLCAHLRIGHRLEQYGRPFDLLPRRHRR